MLIPHIKSWIAILIFGGDGTPYTHRRTGFISIGGAVVYIARKYLGPFLDFFWGDFTPPPPPEIKELRLQ
jgi:hypothetical protein